MDFFTDAKLGRELQEKFLVTCRQLYYNKKNAEIICEEKINA